MCWVFENVILGLFLADFISPTPLNTPFNSEEYNKNQFRFVNKKTHFDVVVNFFFSNVIYKQPLGKMFLKKSPVPAALNRKKTVVDLSILELPSFNVLKLVTINKKSSINKLFN